MKTEYPAIQIQGYTYRLTYVATFELGYIVDEKYRYRCDTSEYANSTWRYLGDSKVEMYETLGYLLANS